MTEQYYRFKYSNISLVDYIKDRKLVAELKRREANIIVREADIIDTEMRWLESNLLPVTESNDEVTK